jgi:hypothetical protein
MTVKRDDYFVTCDVDFLRLSQQYCVIVWKLPTYSAVRRTEPYSSAWAAGRFVRSSHKTPLYTYSNKDVYRHLVT